ncbi:hypothetical protein [Deinococcus pimensis]|uniref:hypothetical protein n=1 Tax=Deinococcus pimensis TaxID=309888 RepID=UPI0004896A0D|nr:hypothetical protein [Deinococcus pimensis]
MDINETTERPFTTYDGRVYVLRLWYEGPEHAPAWRASVREGTTGARRYFLSVDECLEHLYTELLRR